MQDNRKQYAIIALTAQGKKTALRLQDRLKYPSVVYTMPKLTDDTTVPLEGKVTEAIKYLFTEVEALICIMATGIVVRAIAPVVADKAADPAVIVMDERAQNVISLLSGHLGGANALTCEIAEVMEANPVITTATDVQNVVALDTLAKSVNGWRQDLRPLIKPFNLALGSRETVYFYQEKDWIHDVRGLTVIGKEDVKRILDGQDLLILLLETPLSISRPNVAIIYPKPYILGVGARKNISYEVFRAGFLAFCKKERISPKEIDRIVSIDVKKEELAIIRLAEELQCPFETYTKEELASVADKYPQSAFVKQTVGVGSVALASADVASQGNVLTDRFALNGCTYALAKATN